ncbi:S1C family serine protease [Moraxella oblonga]|uniref:S1C family serine protease n=1 Tax=Moraxella oblonga TaxID=200413 RepID=UPI00082F9A22|nr:trypsin-like peptidase domain-containing protein [Moraxella oblonga]
MKKSMKNNQLGFSLLKIFPWLLVIVMASLFFWVVQNPKQNGQALQGYLPQSMQPSQTQGSQASEPVAITPSTLLLKDVAPTPALASTPAVSSYHDAVALASPSVVNIYTTQKVQNPYANDPVLSQLFEYYGQKQQDISNLGSGVIIAKDGYIVTNAHVIEKADEVIVALNDGRKAHAKIIGQDTESDLAVIKIELDNLKPLAFRTDPIRVGDVALAIGNPFGVGQTVTQGIISATGRAGLGTSMFEDFVQTDAAINPGNSGGALVDAHGALIGINTMIYSRSGGSVGLGFAIPTSIVEQVVDGLIKHGKVSRGWLGIEIAHNNDLTDLSTQTGVQITHVGQGTPAQKAGLQNGDVVLSINGTTTNDPNTLIGLVSKTAPNNTLSMVILRNNQQHNLSVTVGERPTKNQSQNLQNLSPEELAQLQELLRQMERFNRQ